MPETGCGNNDNGITTPIGQQYYCQNLFFMEKGGNAPSPDLSVRYLNVAYWLHDEQPRTGWSLPTFSLVRELLALNTDHGGRHRVRQRDPARPGAPSSQNSATAASGSLR